MQQLVAEEKLGVAISPARKYFRDLGKVLRFGVRPELPNITKQRTLGAHL